MAELSSDYKMLGKTKIGKVRIQKRLGKSVLTGHGLGDKINRIWKPDYVFMDFIENSDPSLENVLVSSESNKRLSWYFKSLTLLLALIVVFILGLMLGATFPIFIASKRIPLVTNAKETINIERNSFNLDSVPFNSSTLTEPSILYDKIVNGIYWSDFVDVLLPHGFGIADDFQWRDLVHKSAVVRIEEGCGRMQNRLLTFRDGTKACCRYRQNTDQIQGEIFSYLLGRALQLESLVPSALMAINSSDPFWEPVKGQLEASQWLDGHTVVLTEFLEDLVPARIPPTLRNFTSEVFDIKYFEASKKESLLKTFKIENTKSIMNILDHTNSEEDFVEMAQWSDLIVFDYLTANLDRIVNNLYNLQWNPGMLSSPAHNLAQVSSSNLLVFLDNESGLLHGYRLLEKYEPYHSLLMNALCVFRRPTIEALKKLQSHIALSAVLQTDGSQDLLPSLPDRNINILSQRIEHVLTQVDFCLQRLQDLH